MFRAGQKIRIKKIELNSTRKSSIESEPKLIKYSNGFKVFVFK